MAIIKNALTYGFGFNVTAAGPVDSRMRVNYLTDLTTVWGTSVDGVFTPNPEAPVYAGMMVVVNETNTAYILKQAVDAEGNLVYDGTDVDKRKPIAADPTVFTNWMTVGTDFSGDISSLNGKVTAVENKLNVAADSGLDATSALKVKIDSTVTGNILQVSENGLSVVASQSEYSLDAVDSPESGYAAQYQFKKDGQVQTTINIPKDQFLKSASYNADADELVFVFDTAAGESTSRVSVKDLVDTYTAGSYITITDNAVAVDYEALKTQLDTDLRGAFGIATLTTGVSENSAAIEAINEALNNETTGIKVSVTNNANEISAVKGSVTTLSGTVNEHTTAIGTINSTLSAFHVRDVDTDAAHGIALTHTSSAGDGNNDTVGISVDIDTLAAAVIAKHEVPTPDAGDIKLSAVVGTISADSTVQAALENLDSRIKAAVSGGVTGIAGGSGITVDSSDVNNPSIAVNTSALVADGSALSVENNKIDLIWAEL